MKSNRSLIAAALVLAALCALAGLRAPVHGKTYVLAPSEDHRSARRSHDGLFSFTENEGWKQGFLDKAGKAVVPPAWVEVAEFSEGLACVKVDGARGTQLFAFIDKTGAMAIPAQSNFVTNRYESIAGCRFSEGRAALKVAGGGYVYIDRTGKVAIPVRYEWAGDFSEDVAPVKTGGKFFFIDRNGRNAIKYAYDSAAEFHEGMARASSAGKDGFIDKTGAFVYQRASSQVMCRNFSGGLAYVEEITDKGWCRPTFINKSGKTVITLASDGEAVDFSEGTAAVKVGGKWGYVNAAGSTVITPRFEEAGAFSDGLAPVCLGGKWGYIDRTGAVVIPPQFNVWAEPFCDGLARVATYDKGRNYRGYIGRNGKYVHYWINI